MCLPGCLEDTDCCAGCDVVWKCIPGLCCGYGERSRSHEFLDLCSVISSLFAERIFPRSGSYGLTRLHKLIASFLLITNAAHCFAFISVVWQRALWSGDLETDKIHGSV